MTGLLAAIKALGALKWATGAFSWFPGAWPFAGALSAVLGALGAFVRMVFKGVTQIVANPVTLVAAGTCAAFAFGYGLRVGVNLDGRQAVAAVKACNLRVSEIELKHNRGILAGIESARRAEDAVEELPADITAACKRSASCRSRNEL